MTCMSTDRSPGETLDIQSLAYGGDAVGRLADGRTAFVRGACPGDAVEIRVVEDRGRFVRAEVARIVSASPDRVAPRCPYFGVCGGCQWQHVSYSAQLVAKRQAVVDALARIGKVENADELVRETIASPAEYGYRNKVELLVDRASGRPRLGYHEAHSERFVEVEECHLLPKAQLKAPKALGGALRYISGEQDLGLSRVAIRVAANTRDVEVALWGEPGPFPRKPVASTLGQAMKMSSLVRVLVKGPVKERKIAGVEVLSGSGFWRERLLGTTMTVSAPSFFQVNTRAAEKLVEAALAAAEVDGTDHVVDLYAGAGTFTIALAELAGEVTAIESASSAVKDLRRNLEDAQVWADVVGGDALRELPELGHVDCLLVDPPRSGLHERAIPAIAGSGATRVVYVSCDPSTLARDARLLAEQGFELVSATPVDLFPQTYHVETVAAFRKR